ncbi:MAG TPA: carbamoyltransferase HypF [Oculatellaceae cyanobacterium]
MSTRVRVEGIVQGVGFRPFVYLLAREIGLCGWVLNDALGVEIQLDGQEEQIEEFLLKLPAQAPQAAKIEKISRNSAPPSGFSDFRIVESRQTQGLVTTRISPDLATCESCLKELFRPDDRHYQYPYVNCTHCGPRFSIIKSLPYDRIATTMSSWKMCQRCRAGYEDPSDRRFHAQPVACAQCGPNYYLTTSQANAGTTDCARGIDAIARAAALLRDGKIVALKGIGGYHLAVDATNSEALSQLRLRKYRKDKPFALMVDNLERAQMFAHLSSQAKTLLSSSARPIVLAPVKEECDLPLHLIAPDNLDLGLMLPYTPLHHLLFAEGAPSAIVLTSANKSSEPLAYEDDSARQELDGIADMFLVGQRAIQRRIDDSVIATSRHSSHVVRRARGLAPGIVAMVPTQQTVLALGADLKNTIALVVAGQAIVSQYIGDLEYAACRRAFTETIDDFCNMYTVDRDKLLIACDKHPQYVSTRFAAELEGTPVLVQHHQAHVASVLAESGMYSDKVIGIAFDGTGWGDDEAIWGGEFFIGSIQAGFRRVASLQYASMPGGDAAAKFPPQALAGFLASAGYTDAISYMERFFSPRFKHACQAAAKNLRTWPSSSIGRLFDAAAAVAGFDREITFEAQAAIWLEHQARRSISARAYPFSVDRSQNGDRWELGWHEALRAMVDDKKSGLSANEMSRAFHNGLAAGTIDLATRLCEEHGVSKIAISGGVMQNMLFFDTLLTQFESRKIQVFWNEKVPCNDGGLSLGQAAIACYRQ